ncbi:MAG: O-antigen ligase family protein, partial [Patescibacteria group bacterium]|nr:O-antigen ligase family protein [Patescibacteria group bacterium]
IKKMPDGLGTVITLLAFFLTFSRSAYIVLLITTLLTVLILLKRHSGEPKGRLQNLIKDGFWTSQNDERIISKILLIIIIFGFIIFGAIFLRSIPSTVSNFSQSSLSLRLAEWQGSWSAVINRPWWRQLAGYGPETVYYTFFKYRPAVYNYSAQEQIVGPNQIRNYYLHLLSGIGLIGLILYLWIYFKILRRSYKNSRDNILDTGIFFSLLAIALYSFFYYQTESVLPLFWVLAGVSLSGGKIHFNNIYHYSGKLLGILFIVLAPFLFYGLGCAAVADYYGSSYPSEQNFLQAVKLNPIIDAYQRNLSKLYMLEMLSLKDNNKNLALKKYLQGKEAIDKALAISPLDIRNQRQLVLVNYYAGVNLNKTYQKENIPESVKLVHMAPSDYMSWDMLGLVYLNVGDLNQARSAFLKERSLNSSGPGVWLHLGEVSKQQGKLDEAINYYETAVRISHNWGFAVNELNKALELKHNFLRTK